jgi:hypothetical protein
MELKYNNDDDILRYLRDEMEDDERLAFEAEMADSQDLRLEVFLIQQRRSAIQSKLKSAIVKADLMEHDTIAGPTKMPERKSYKGLLIGVIGLLALGAMIWAIMPKKPDQSTVPPPQPTASVSNGGVSVDSLYGAPAKTNNPLDELSVGRERSKEKNRPDIFAANYKPYMLESGILGKDKKIPRAVNSAEAAYKKKNLLVFDTLLSTDTLGKHRPYILQLAAHAAMQKEKYEQAINYWHQYRAVPGYQDEEIFNLALCYAARFGNRNEDLKKLSEQYQNDSTIINLYQSCFSKSNKVLIDTFND